MIKGIAVIIGVYAVCLLFFQPYRYNFPLNDDWAYSYSVEKFQETGRIELSDWASASVLFQFIAGILFSKLFGYSFSSLILSNFFMSMAGAIFLYLLLSEMNYKNKLFPALILVFNPLYFVLGFSFMTDVPYLAMFIISIYFYLKGAIKDNALFLVIGSVFAGAAFLIRQLGILIPVCVLIYLLIMERKKIGFKEVCSVFALPVAVCAIYLVWFNFIHGRNWAIESGVAGKISFEGFYYKLLGSLFYFGLFYLPFAVAYPARNNQYLESMNLSKAKKISFVALVLVLISHFFIYGNMPYSGNIIYKSGLGAVTVSGMAGRLYPAQLWIRLSDNLGKFTVSEMVNKDAGIISTNGFWLIVTILSGFSFLVLVLNILSQKFKKEEIFLILCCGIQFFISLIRFQFIDRYFLVILPLIIILGSRSLEFSNKLQKVVAVVIFILLVSYSALGVKDYLSWNEAKWKLGEILIKKHGLKPEEIANGFDWDGYFTYQKNMDKLKAVKPLQKIGEWEWQSLNPYKVVVSYKNDFPGERLVEYVEYMDWFVFKKRKIYAWKLI